MAKPLVEFPDPETAVRAYYGSAYVGTIADRAPTRISTDPPQVALTSGWWLQVEFDGTPDGSSWVESPTIRVNCHRPSTQRSNVKADASLAAGLLRAHPGDDAVMSTVPLVGRSSVITDPATKNLMCWFTFRVNMRPAVLSV